MFNDYPQCKVRIAQGLREILEWPPKDRHDSTDPIELLPAKDGSGVGAALVAAMTLERAKKGDMAGTLRSKNFK